MWLGSWLCQIVYTSLYQILEMRQYSHIRLSQALPKNNTEASAEAQFEATILPDFQDWARS